MAHDASTALPPRWNIIAPAWAPSGLPVIATQCWPCSTGLCGRSARAPRPRIRIDSATTKAERDNSAERERIADLLWGPDLIAVRGVRGAARAAARAGGADRRPAGR